MFHIEDFVDRNTACSLQSAKTVAMGTRRVEIRNVWGKVHFGFCDCEQKVCDPLMCKCETVSQH